MTETNKKRTVSLLLLLALVLAAVLPAVSLSSALAEDQVTQIATVYYSTGVNLRSGPGTSNPSLLIMQTGTMLAIQGTAKDKSGNLWYKVTMLNDPEVGGYVHSGYVIVTDVVNPPPDEADQYEAYLEEQGFPESYREALHLLHNMYPEWVFIADHTNIEWQRALNAESVIGRNLVPRSSNRLWINTSDVDSSGNQISRDGYNWVAASPEIVAYYLDPRNFLNISHIFQFESLSYNSEVHTAQGVDSLLEATFMNSGVTVTCDGVDYTFTDIFMAAAEASGASPYHLASRARQEQGTGGTLLSGGAVPGYTGYYNFFNINAYTTSSASSSVNGAMHAQKQGWDNQYKSIVGGAHFIASRYIAKGQDTLYYQKFNVVNPADGLFSHQYMTNVTAAASEASSLRNAYSDHHTPIAFTIPVYLDMPPSAVPRPSETTVPSVTLSGITLSGEYIKGASVGTDAEAVLSAATVSNGGSVKIIGTAGTEKTEGAIASGDKLNLYYAGGSLYKSYSFIVPGDCNGDGERTIVDLLSIQRHLLDISHLSGTFRYSADLNGDGNITILDLLTLQKKLLGIS